MSEQRVFTNVSIFQDTLHSYVTHSESKTRKTFISMYAFCDNSLDVIRINVLKIITYNNDRKMNRKSNKKRYINPIKKLFHKCVT